MLAASCARYGLPQRPQWLEELLTARSFLYRRVLSMIEEGATEKQTYGVEVAGGRRREEQAQASAFLPPQPTRLDTR